MKRSCIFGCEKAGSGEHVFPATLGGRRVNKGILCKEHNNGLAPLAAVLSEQLRTLNALLGVLPDHNKKTPHSTVVTSHDGREFQMSVDGIRPKGGHVISESPIDENSVDITMEFGSQKELEKFIAEKKDAGFGLELGEVSNVSRVHYGLHHNRISLGGEDGLRAVGYVALTFLAHRFPDVARSSSLEPFRNFLLGQGRVNDFVWWLEPPIPDDENPYQFGHKIEVTVPACGEAFGRITFFSCLAFGVSFGHAKYGENGTVVTYINPLATSAPNDLVETRREAADIGIIRPSAQSRTLDDAISTGSAKRSLAEFWTCNGLVPIT